MNKIQNVFKNNRLDEWEKAQYSPLYVEGVIDDWQEVLERYISKAEIKRLIKQGGIKIGNGGYKELWVKVGKRLLIIDEPVKGGMSLNEISRQAQVWFEYHWVLKPKTIDWKNIKE